MLNSGAPEWGLGADPGLESLDIGPKAAQDLRHLIHDPGPVLANQSKFKRFAVSAIAVDGRRDPHLQAMGVDRADRQTQTVRAVGRHLDKDRSDVKTAKPAEVAFKPVASGGKDRGGQRLGQAGPVAADHA